MYEEFGSKKRYYRPDLHYAVITASVSLGLPFMSWQYMIPGGDGLQKINLGNWGTRDSGGILGVNHRMIWVPLNSMASLT